MNKIGDAAAEDPTICIKVAAAAALSVPAFVVMSGCKSMIRPFCSRCIAPQVRIMKATNLPAKDGSGEKGTCDAYVKVTRNVLSCLLFSCCNEQRNAKDSCCQSTQKDKGNCC